MQDFVERKLGDLTVRIDRLRCIASSNCMEVAPEVFEYDGEKDRSRKPVPGNCYGFADRPRGTFIHLLEIAYNILL